MTSPAGAALMSLKNEARPRSHRAVQRCHQATARCDGPRVCRSTPAAKGWALLIASIRYNPQQAPWLAPRDEVQLDHDEFVEEMSIGGTTDRSD